jgi:hypothetical protein
MYGDSSALENLNENMDSKWLGKLLKKVPKLQPNSLQLL